MALLSAYAAIAIYVADDRLHIAVYGLPIVLSSVVAAVPRWSSPHAITWAGVGSFVPVCLLGIDAAWGPIASLLSVAQLIMITLYGLSLVEEHHRAGVGGRDSRTPDGDGLLSPDLARSIMTRELRRSRRTRSPVSLLLFEETDRLEPSKRRELIGTLTGHVREFDTIFATSPSELGILCVDTNRTGARQYAERIRTITGVSDFSVASFPDDAVTAQGLFDSARRRPERQPRSEPAVAAE